MGKMIKTKKSLGAAAQKLKNIIPFMGSDEAEDAQSMAELERAKKEIEKARYEVQQRRLETINALFGNQIIATIPLQEHEVRGIDKLYEICDILYGDDTDNGPIAL